MTTTTFTNGVTLTDAAWFQDANDVVYASIGITPGSAPASKSALIYLLLNGLSADATPDPTADYVATLDASATTGKKVLLSKLTAYKVITTTRDMTAASGNVPYTGAGFAPKAVASLASVASSSAISWGFSDGTTSGSLYDDAAAAGTYGVQNGDLAGLYFVGARQTAAVASLDSDGMTLTWTKVGSPTGTATMFFLFFR